VREMHWLSAVYARIHAQLVNFHPRFPMLSR
jgi:hypothetical protein